MTISASAAQRYADYRPRYPARLIDDLLKRTVGDRGERLVDWGFGTGELTLPTRHLQLQDIAKPNLTIAYRP